jgi:diguanylate cyclase (GGDEF)-like protein/PAS domain S-box-containing protein
MDVRTLFVAIAIAYGTFGVLLFAFERTHRTNRPMALIAFAFLMMGLGIALQAGRGDEPDWLSIVVGNLLTWMGLAYQALGVIELTGTRVGARGHALGVVLPALAVLALVPLGSTGRIVGASMIYSGLFLIPAVVALTWRTERSLLRVLIGGTFAVIAVLYLLRMTLALTHGDSNMLFVATGADQSEGIILYTAIFLGALVTGFGLLLLSKQSADEELGEALAELQAIYATLPTGLLVGQDRVIVRANPAVEAMSGYGPGELVGVPSRVMYLNDQAYEENGQRIYSSLASTGHWEGEVQFRKRTGEPFWVWMQVGRLAGASSGRAIVISVTDITQQKETEAELAALATVDELTGLPNRRAVLDIASRAISAAHRARRPLSIALLDLDGFKGINDTRGHAFGDECLRHLARIARNALRTEDVIARFGGDEFVVLLPEQDAGSAEAAMRRVLEHLRQSPVIDGHGSAIRLLGTVGVAQLLPDEGLDELLARADQAMYAAKQSGGDAVRGRVSNERLSGTTAANEGLSSS